MVVPPAPNARSRRTRASLIGRLLHSIFGRRAIPHDITTEVTEPSPPWVPQSAADLGFTHAPRMFGIPGTGLLNANFEGKAVSRGIAGEVNFAKTLQATGDLNRFTTFWSVSLPDSLATDGESPDIDCVLVGRDTVYLVDVKNWRTSNDLAWHLEGRLLRCTDIRTGREVGRPRVLSHNMRHATVRVRRALRTIGVDWKVAPRIVIMPSVRGAGHIGRAVLEDTTPIVTLDMLLAELASDFGVLDGPDSTALTALFGPLLKGPNHADNEVPPVATHRRCGTCGTQTRSSDSSCFACGAVA